MNNTTNLKKHFNNLETFFIAVTTDKKKPKGVSWFPRISFSYSAIVKPVSKKNLIERRLIETLG